MWPSCGVLVSGTIWRPSLRLWQTFSMWLGNANPVICRLQMYLLKLCVLIWSLLWTVFFPDLCQLAALDKGCYHSLGQQLCYSRLWLIKLTARDWQLQWSPLGVRGTGGDIWDMFLTQKDYSQRVCWCLGVSSVHTFMCFLFAIWCRWLKIEKATLSHFSSCHSTCQYVLLCKQAACQHNRLIRLCWKPLLC